MVSEEADSYQIRTVQVLERMVKRASIEAGDDQDKMKTALAG